MQDTGHLYNYQSNYSTPQAARDNIHKVTANNRLRQTDRNTD